MSFSREKSLLKICSAVFLILTFSLINLSAQTKKNSAASKKNQTSAKTPAKNSKEQIKSSKEQAKHSKETDKKLTKPEKSAKSKTVDAKSKFDAKNKPEDKKRRAAEAAQARAAQEAQRQAALAEARRRAEIARAAQARKIAFERGLRSETVDNILKDNLDGEDFEVRRAAVNALGNHAGTIVVLDPQTGKVLSIVNQDWAIRKSFKPCSTIKLVTAVAGINENVINADGSIRNRRFPLGLDDAIAFSNNSYFQTVGSGLGNERMIYYAKMLGLGQPTGINAEGETGGRLPYGNNNARIYSHGDDFDVTPLQLGVIVSAISNGGRIVIPQIPRTRIDKTNFRGAMRYQLDLPNNNFRNVIPGMIGAAQYGTARRGMDSTLAVAGKTGSCIEQGSWVGLFASVAPIENPKLSIVVITHGQGERGKYAAAIAAQIYQSLRGRLIESGDRNVAKIPLDLRPQTKVNAKTAARLDTDEDSDSADNDASENAKKQTISNHSAPKTTQKNQEKTGELFPPVIVKVKKSGEVTRPRIVPNK